MRRVLMVVCGGLTFAAPASSMASGGPVSPIQGSPVTVPGSTASYVAIGAGPNTAVRQVRRGDRKLERSVRLPGSFGVPGVAIDGSTTGLSADGRTLVLAGIAPTYPQRSTTLVVLDTGRLVTCARIALGGFYTVDAISPTGRWLYLIHYVSPIQDITRYEVRAYDLSSRYLVRQPVIDPRDREAMLGVAITRATSANGRWAYTLYDRPGSTPFIHALDSQGRKAVCVDLPTVAEHDVFNAQLALANRGETLRVERLGIPIAIVDTRTFAVGRPGSGLPRTAPRRAASTSHGGGVWLPLGAAVLAGLGAVALLSRRSRAARSAPA